MGKPIWIHPEFESEVSGEVNGAGYECRVEDLYVAVVISGVSIDITSLLSSAQKSRIEDMLRERREEIDMETTEALHG